MLFERDVWREEFQRAPEFEVSGCFAVTFWMYLKDWWRVSTVSMDPSFLVRSVIHSRFRVQTSGACRVCRDVSRECEAFKRF